MEDKPVKRPSPPTPISSKQEECKLRHCEKIQDAPSSIIGLAKDVYLSWFETYNVGWTSYPLWSGLSDTLKLFWVNFALDTTYRCNRLETS
jgi:hypothetical protein